MDVGLFSKIYVVMVGEVIVMLGDGMLVILGVMDSCFIFVGEVCEVCNKGNVVVSMIVVMFYVVVVVL